MSKTKIQAKMKLGAIVQKYPETVEIFFKYGLPCASCHIASFETLEEGAVGHGIKGKKLDKLLEELNAVVNTDRTVGPAARHLAGARSANPPTGGLRASKVSGSRHPQS